MGFILPLENFSLIWRLQHYQILTFVRLSWPLSHEGSLACHTYYDTGHSFIMVISEDPWRDTRAFSSGTVTTCFYDLGLSRLGFKRPTFRLRVQRSNPLRIRRSHALWINFTCFGFQTKAPCIMRESDEMNFELSFIWYQAEEAGHLHKWPRRIQSICRISLKL